MRTRFVVAILSLALVYAFTCSANCANCLGSSAAAATPSHDCGHAAGADRGLHPHAPAKPDCSGHLHAGFEAVQGGGLSQVQLSATSGASQSRVDAVSSEAVNVAMSFLADGAPPRDVENSPLQKISILRI